MRQNSTPGESRTNSSISNARVLDRKKPSHRKRAKRGEWSLTFCAEINTKNTKKTKKKTNKKTHKTPPIYDERNSLACHEQDGSRGAGKGGTLDSVIRGHRGGQLLKSGKRNLRNSCRLRRDPLPTARDISLRLYLNARSQGARLSMKRGRVHTQNDLFGRRYTHSKDFGLYRKRRILAQRKGNPGVTSTTNS